MNNENIENDNFGTMGLNQVGARKVATLVEKNPHLKNQIGKSTWVDCRHHSTNLSGIHIEDIRKTLEIPNSITSGEGVAGLLSNVSTGFSDYGTHTITLDMSKVSAIAEGKETSAKASR